MSDVAVHAGNTRRKLELLAAGLRQAVTLTLRAAEEAAIESAKGTTRFKDRTGETRGSIRGEVIGMRGFVQAGGVAKFLEYGTKPHTIRATAGKTMRFTVAGRTVFARMVHHPGTKERPFMREARDRAEQAAEYGAEFYINYAIERA